MKRKLEILALVLYLCVLHVASSRKIFTWRCTDGEECWRERHAPGTKHTSLEKCKLTCGPHATLLPLPKRVSLSKETQSFLPKAISNVNIDCVPNVCALLDEAVKIMNETLLMYHPDYKENSLIWENSHPNTLVDHDVIIQISVTGDQEYIHLSINESYGLRINTVGKTTFVFIVAPTFFGARHALETFSQLVDYDVDNNALMVITEAFIQDSPQFTYRGFIIDTSRNYITVSQIKKVLRAMAYSKLNTFHWHITDTHSFPLLLNTLPIMAEYGAYSDKEVYTPSDIRDIVQYARVRGIRVLPEIDAPSHTGHGWQWGEESDVGKLVVCLDRIPWKDYCLEPPCGQLNLANPNIYKILQIIYNEVASLFKPLDMFHYGGDEVSFHCWNTSSEISDWMIANNFGVDSLAYYQQWGSFQNKARDLLTKANNGIEVPGVIWTSKLTEHGNADKYFDKNKYIIQIWRNGTDHNIADLLKKGFRVIFSNSDSMYLDCGASSWVAKGTNWCSPYKGWQDLYDNDLYGMVTNLTKSTQFNEQILGGEAALWTEQVDTETMDAKLWPRGAALAERLWTNPTTDYSKAEYRMLQNRHRLVKRGISASRLQPEWCRQNQGQCRNTDLPKA